MLLSAPYHCLLYKHRRQDERQLPKSSWPMPICTLTYLTQVTSFMAIPVVRYDITTSRILSEAKYGSYFEFKIYTQPYVNWQGMGVFRGLFKDHYSDVIIIALASQIIDVSIVYSTVSSGTDQRKHQSSRRWPLWEESAAQRPVTRKFFHLMTSSCNRSRDIGSAMH